jgi:hypothetical protein
MLIVKGRTPSFLRSYDVIRAVAKREGVDMDKYGDVLRLHVNDHAHTPTSKSVEEWRADPSVISVTEAGLPPGWVKIVRLSPAGERKVFFKSPSRANIR